MNPTKETVTQALIQHLKPVPHIISAWEGGSAAHQRTDSYSDLDLILIVEDQKVEETFKSIEEILQMQSPLSHQWRVPEPTWHGHSQSFYKLKEGSPYFFIDLVIMKESSPQRFMEVERHGKPIIYFDKKNLVKSESVQKDEFFLKMKTRLKNIEQSFPFFKAITLKEIERNRPIDAYTFYQRLVGFLVEAWGMKYRPFRYDFGLRYTSLDFPKEIQGELYKFCYVSNPSEIKTQIAKLEIRFHKTLNEVAKR